MCKNMYQQSRVEYLKNLSTEIIREGEYTRVIYTLNERTGVVKYHELPPFSKLQPVSHLLMVEVNMIDIIDEINKTTPLSDDDLPKLQMEIREDSLNRITQWEGQGLQR